jgi:hypothetical protein
VSLRRIRHAALISVAVLYIAAATEAASSGGYHRCGPASGGGGASNLRVKGVSCHYASTVTQGGLTQSGRLTRVGHFHCRHVRRVGMLHYTCVRNGGRRGMKFATF